MAQLEGKIQQTLEGKVSISGTWHMVGVEAVKSPFEYHSVVNSAPVRAANPGESAGTELPGTGMYAGQFVYYGKKAALAIGNVLPLSQMPEGSVICMIEQYRGDRSKLVKCSGDYAVIITHDEDNSCYLIRHD